MPAPNSVKGRGILPGGFPKGPIPLDEYINLVMPEHMHTLWETFPRQSLLDVYYLIMNRSKKFTTTSMTPKHWENLPLEQSFKVTTINPLGGTKFEFILDASSYNPDGNNFLRIGDVIYNKNWRLNNFPVGRIYNVVWDKVAMTTTVYVNDEVVGSSIATDFESGDIFIDVTNSYARGAGQPEALSPTIQMFQSKVQTIKETFGGDGMVRLETPWVQKDQNGNTINSMLDVAKADTTFEFNLKKYRALMFGPGVDGIDEDPKSNTYGQPISYTEGFFTAASKRGTPLDAAVFMALPPNQQMVILTNIYSKLYLKSKNHWWLMGQNMMNNIVDGWKTYLDNNSESYTSIINSIYPGAAEFSKKVNMNINAINRNGYGFALQIWDSMSDAAQFGAPGFNGQDVSLICPLLTGVDKMTGETLDSLQVGFTLNNQRSREFKISGDGIWYGEGRGPLDIEVFYMLGDIVARTLAGETFVTIK